MKTTQEQPADTGTSADDRQTERYDAIVIGAGLSGMYQLHRLRELGLSAPRPRQPASNGNMKSANGTAANGSAKP